MFKRKRILMIVSLVLVLVVVGATGISSNANCLCEDCKVLKKAYNVDTSKDSYTFFEFLKLLELERNIEDMVHGNNTTIDIIEDNLNMSDAEVTFTDSEIDNATDNNVNNDYDNNDSGDNVDQDNYNDNITDVNDNNSSEEVSAPQIKVLSQNLRVNNANDGVDNTLAKRLPRIKQIIDKYDADINCFQECSLEWKPYTDDIFSSLEYTCVYMKTNVGHCNPIYVKNSRFDVIDSGSFELSTADTDTTYNENRVASWIIVKDKISSKSFMMVNGHLPLIIDTQISACNKIMEVVKSKNVDGYLICGDFNFTSSSNTRAYDIMTSNGTKDMESAAATEGTVGVSGGTFHNYGKMDSPNRIDFFFGSDSLNSDMHTVVNDTFDGLYPSDHYGIVNYVSIR